MFYKKKKILILANCQHNSIRENIILYLNNNQYEVSSFYHTQLLINKKMMISLCDEADIIISQLFSNKFDFFESKNMKHIYKNKCIIVPNLYFRGYHPDLVYIGNENDRLRSSLGDYHSAIIFLAFTRKLPVSDAINLFRSKDLYKSSKLTEVYKTSLMQLKEKEKYCDIIISDFINDNFRQKALFYTVNHPSSLLIAELIKRILQFLDIKYINVPDYILRDPLISLSQYSIHMNYSQLMNIKFFQPLFVEPINIKNGFNGYSMSLNQFARDSYKLYKTLDIENYTVGIPEANSILDAIDELSK